jgi:hypothetical protein
MFHAPRVMSFLKLVACCLSLVVFLAVVIVASSDDENPRGDAFAGALIFLMVATVSYRYWTGLDWGGPPGTRLMPKIRAATWETVEKASANFLRPAPVS